MLTVPVRARRLAQGISMIEVLITIIILSVGLLGLAALHTKMQVAGFESHQRAQALMLLSDISERMNSRRSNAADYSTTASLGTGDTQPTSCSTLAVGAPRDLCEWSNALKGAAEMRNTAKTGAMLGARGCIRQVRAPDAALCRPGTYLITVAWQGMHPIAAPSLSCAQGLYGTDDGYRRAIASEVVVGLPSCL